MKTAKFTTTNTTIQSNSLPNTSVDLQRNIRPLLRLVFVLLFVMIIFPSISQNQDVFHLSGNKINVVVVESSEKTILKNNSFDLVKVVSNLEHEGKNYGIQLPNERPDFKILKKISGDTLYIVTPKRFSPSVIGVSTYREEIVNTIEIPFDKVVLIPSAQNLQIDNHFVKLHIKNANSVVVRELKREELSRLHCVANVAFSLNGKKSAQTYEINHLGNSDISISAEVIQLTLKE